MIEKYYKCKSNYSNYVVFIKFGSFYEVFDNDSLIVSKLTGYKVKRISSTIKCGFPLNKLSDVLLLLDEKHVNYVVNMQILNIKESIINGRNLMKNMKHLII